MSPITSFSSFDLLRHRVGFAFTCLVQCLFRSTIFSAALGTLLLVGCNDRGGSTTPRVAPTAGEHSDREEMGRRLLTSGSDMLNDLDNFDEGTVEFALQQVVRRLNEGLATLPNSADRPAPLTIDDGRVLREIVWLRDAGRFAVGDETDPLRRAERLFDWMVRNIQLIPPDAPEAKLPFLPWHELLLGRATALDRAWIFQLLARQQQLDVVLLAFPTQGNAKPADLKPADLKPWCAALLLDKQLYLFDARIGAPIRTKDGQHTATLAQVSADDSLLRALDLDGKPYPAKAADLGKLVAIMETTCTYVEPRFDQIGRELVGRNKLELKIDPAATEAQLKQVPGIAQVIRWPLGDERFAASRPSEKEANEGIRALLTPFNLPRNDPNRINVLQLLKARIRHFSGKYYENPLETDPELKKLSINRYYQAARPAEEELIAGNTQQDKRTWALAHRVKQNATYWLGLVAYDLKNYDAARGYFELDLKEKTSADWATGSRYNLGRTYEAESAAATDPIQKQALLKQALTTYRTAYFDIAPDDQSLERAKWLESQSK